MQLTNSLYLALTALTLSATPALSLGINCRGSTECGTLGTSEVSRKLVGFIKQADPNRYYKDGERIACVREPHPGAQNGAFCAFLQGSKGAPAHSLQVLAHEIPDHGCNKCGSVPLFFDRVNDNKDGELTFNYVSSGCGKSGLC